jgi:hypothetical protein
MYKWLFQRASKTTSWKNCANILLLKQHKNKLSLYFLDN